MCNTNARQKEETHWKLFWYDDDAQKLPIVFLLR